MTQLKIIKNIKEKTGLRTDPELARFLGLAEKGAIARMKRNDAGASVHSLCEVISLLLDRMTEAQRISCVELRNERLRGVDESTSGDGGF